MIDQTGTVLFSKRFENDENELLALIATIADMAAGDEVCWATDLNAGGAASRRTTHRGHGKTDAKDARIITHQARMRADLQPVRGADQISVDLRLLTARLWTCS